MCSYLYANNSEIVMKPGCIFHKTCLLILGYIYFYWLHYSYKTKWSALYMGRGSWLYFFFHFMYIVKKSCAIGWLHKKTQCTIYWLVVQNVGVRQILQQLNTNRNRFIKHWLIEGIGCRSVTNCIVCNNIPSISRACWSIMLITR